MLISFLRNTRAYYDGRRVLFECSDAFRDYIRSNRRGQQKAGRIHLPCFPTSAATSAPMRSSKHETLPIRLLFPSTKR